MVKIKITPNFQKKPEFTNFRKINKGTTYIGPQTGIH